MDELRIGIVGSRRRNSLIDRNLVFEIVRQAIERNPHRRVVVVSGACPKGADRFAAEAARVFGCGLVEFPVPLDPPIEGKWDYAKRAYARNFLIAEYCHVLFALVHPDRTGGTENTVSHATDLGRKTYIIPSQHPEVDLRTDAGTPPDKA